MAVLIWEGSLSLANRHRRRRTHRLLLALGIGLLAASLLACTRPTPEPVTPTPTASQPTATPTGNAPEGEPGNATATTALQVWLPPDISRASVTVGGHTQLYSDAVAGQSALPDSVRLVVTTKSLHGPGGMLESVLATAPVAPQRLPHLILLDSTDLPALVAAQLAQPITTLDEATFWQTLQPVASAAVTLDEARYGAPLCADLLLLAYDSGQVQAPPATWQELLGGQEAVLFPGAPGAAASDPLTALYLSEGGFVAAAEPVLDTTALARALGVYQLGREAGRIHADSVGVADADSSWAAYAAGKADMVVTTSLQLLQSGEDAPSTAIAALPRSDTQPVVLARGLTWVIITPDPAMRDLALAYIQAAPMPMPQQLLATRTIHLPVVMSALDETTAGAWYAPLSAQLAIARPLPSFPDYAGLEQALSQAGASVLSGTASPADAASLAAAQLDQAQ